VLENRSETKSRWKDAAQWTSPDTVAFPLLGRLQGS
jgi:hypothetical protein